MYQRLVKVLSRKWKSLVISLKVWELKVAALAGLEKSPKAAAETWKKQWRG